MDGYRQHSSTRQTSLPPLMASTSRPASISPTRYTARSPPRHIDDLSHSTTHMDEKPASLGRPYSHISPAQHSPLHSFPLSSPLQRPPSAVTRHSQSSRSHSRTRGLRIANLLKRWSPMLLYVFVSLGFLAAFVLYKTEVFELLDELSMWLRTDEYFGYAVLFSLIFLTTIPPFPLYSTFIALAGYTFGAWKGAVISYFAAFSGALFVFIMSRMLLKQSITRWLSSCESMQRVICAIEKRPTLLFLIRLAPYPYNVMNCLLAAAPALTLRTYTICTGLSLFKVIIHTGLGASIHSFKDYHNHGASASSSNQANDDSSNMDQLAHVSTGVGIFLCIAILVYLSIVARRAVNEELSHNGTCSSAGTSLPRREDEEERIGFLSPNAAADESDEDDMVESPLNGHKPLPSLSPNMMRL